MHLVFAARIAFVCVVRVGVVLGGAICRIPAVDRVILRLRGTDHFCGAVSRGQFVLLVVRLDRTVVRHASGGHGSDRHGAAFRAAVGLGIRRCGGGRLGAGVAFDQGLRKPSADGREDLLGQLIGVDRRVEDDVAVEFLVRTGQVGLAHSLVELLVLLVEVVAVAAFAHPLGGDLGFDVEDDRQVRHEPLGGPPAEREDRLLVEAAAGRLVGDRRIDVSVGDDDVSGVEAGIDQGRHMVGAVGGEEQGFGTRARRIGVEED